MSNTYVRTLDEFHELHRCPQSGVAWVEDRRSGAVHSAHPSIASSGSLRGMIGLGYWQKSHSFAQVDGYIYNLSMTVGFHDRWDIVAREACQCGGYHS